MNPLDLITIVLFVIAVILGVRSGALPQLMGLVGAALGAVVGLVALPAASGLIEGLALPLRAIIVLTALLGLVALGEALGATAGRSASKALGSGLLMHVRAVIRRAFLLRETSAAWRS